MKNKYERDSERRLLNAVTTIVEEYGFVKVGINRIARVAQCDKVLIYRYFGGLEGLITAWAEKNDFYISAYDTFQEEIESINKNQIRELTKKILIAQLRFLRENKMMQELLIWELSGNSKFKILQDIREKNGHQLQLILNKMTGVHENDMNLYISILVTAIEFIVLYTRQYFMFNGINFNKSGSWEQLENVIQNYIDMLFNTFDI